MSNSEANNLVVDGTGESGLFLGDGQFPPFVVFDINLQQNIAGPFSTREDAEAARYAISNGAEPVLDVEAMIEAIEILDRVSPREHPVVGQRVYLEDPGNLEQSGWYLLHRVRTVSGKIETPDSWVTLCKENNEPGDYITAVAARIRLHQPLKVYALCVGGYPEDRYVTLESDEDDGCPLPEPASTRHPEEVLPFLTYNHAIAHAKNLAARFPLYQFKVIPFAQTQCRNLDEQKIESSPGSELGKAYQTDRSRPALPILAHIPSGESVTPGDECALLFLCPSELNDSAIQAHIDDAIAFANDDKGERSDEVIACLEAQGFIFLGNPPLVKYLPAHRSVLFSRPWIGSPSRGTETNAESDICKPQVNPFLNASQIAVLEAYADGHFAHFVEIDSEDAFNQQLASCGDGLIRFLLVELSTKEDCDSLATAYQRIQTAIANLQAVASLVEQKELSIGDASNH